MFSIYSLVEKLATDDGATLAQMVACSRVYVCQSRLACTSTASWVYSATEKMGNEAELQARLERRIRAALPLLPAQIRLERYLHLRLGHHAIVIDGLASSNDETRGRYDVLVLVDGNPLLMVELKAPGADLSKEDLRQALSYARVHEPMVPLTLVTNGRNNLLRRTYDGSELAVEDIAGDRLKAVLTAGAVLAASASEDAVRTLLGGSRDTWSQMLATWNKEAAEELTGDTRDFSRPIARGLSFERQAAKVAEDRLSQGDRIVVVHGSPLSGVTNALSQIACNPALAPSVFIDGTKMSDGLQFIANRLSRDLSFAVSKDDLRGWLNTVGSLMGVTLVVDGMQFDSVDELVENANAGLIRLVLGMDSETFRRNSIVSGRNQKSQLGRVAVDIEVEPLSDVEFQKALVVLDDSYSALFFNGAQHSPQLRWPRALRVIAATLPAKRKLPPDPDGRLSKLMVGPIPGPMSLEKCSRAFAAEPSLKFDLDALARAYLKDVELHAADPDWLAATWGRPSVDPGLLEREIGEARMDRLSAQGFLSWVDTKDLGPRILVRVEELLCHHVAEEWSAALLKQTDSDALTVEIDALLDMAGVVPTGEVAVAAAIIRAAQKNQTILGVAVPMLLGRRPTTSRLQEGALAELLVKDARIRLLFGEGMDEEVVGNMLPWLVLSHIASWPLAVADYEETANLSIFMTLGVWPTLLYSPPATELAQVPGFHVHEIEGVGSIPCLRTGIVEPLLQAMLGHAHIRPDEILKLAQLAMEKKEAHLAWRVMTVALAAESSADRAVAQVSAEVVKVLREWWGEAMDSALHRHGDSGDKSP